MGRLENTGNVEEATVTATVDKSEHRVREMFGEISGRYDFLNHFLSGGVDYYWRWRTVRQVSPQRAAPILDVCTGTGDLALAYWRRAKGHCAVTGSDFTPEMLRIAEQKRDRAGIPASGEQALTFVEADTQHLPFDSNQFQIVSVAFGLRNVTNTMRGLQEMLRVCAPGGRIAILEFSLPGNAVLRWLYLKYFRYVLPRIGQFLARNQQGAYNYLPDSVADFPYGEKLAVLMREAGMASVRWTPLTFGIATLYVGSKPDTTP